MTQRKIGIILGSLKKTSYSRKLAQAIEKIAPKDHKITIIEIKDLPLFNPDNDKDNNRPQAYEDFRKEVKEQDALIFITPEYNRTIPAALKNALEIGSRPYGQVAFAKKPSLIISQSNGKLGGFGANHHLRQSLVYLDTPLMQQPEVYLSEVHTLLMEKPNSSLKLKTFYVLC
ncbi:NADPH-dependent FMN reductase [Streptococcus didelphis]|uniref:NADPH-dependent FMN reductase n=1 Tax=Streptococcus didelphis TaxID=102886 RepID=UPI0035267BFC